MCGKRPTKVRQKMRGKKKAQNTQLRAANMRGKKNGCKKKRLCDMCGNVYSLSLVVWFEEPFLSQ